MMEGIKNWIMGVIAISFAVSLGEQLVSQKTIARIWSMAGSILVLLAVLMPLTRLTGEEFAVSFSGAKTEELADELRQEGEEHLSLGIAAQLEAYISDKANALGLAGEIRVNTSVEEGVVSIKGVELEMPFDPQLSDYLFRELGFPREEQRWQEE